MLRNFEQFECQMVRKNFQADSEELVAEVCPKNEQRVSVRLGTLQAAAMELTLGPSSCHRFTKHAKVHQACDLRLRGLREKPWPRPSGGRRERSRELSNVLQVFRRLDLRERLP